VRNNIFRKTPLAKGLIEVNGEMHTVLMQSYVSIAMINYYLTGEEIPLSDLEASPVGLYLMNQISYNKMIQLQGVAYISPVIREIIEKGEKIK
jgi:hypothetical protein